jgi:hypothetical protein
MELVLASVAKPLFDSAKYFLPKHFQLKENSQTENISAK